MQSGAAGKINPEQAKELWLSGFRNGKTNGHEKGMQEQQRTIERTSFDKGLAAGHAKGSASSQKHAALQNESYDRGFAAGLAKGRNEANREDLTEEVAYNKGFADGKTKGVQETWNDAVASVGKSSEYDGFQQGQLHAYTLFWNSQLDVRKREEFTQVVRTALIKGGVLPPAKDDVFGTDASKIVPPRKRRRGKL